jgi:PKD domain
VTLAGVQLGAPHRAPRSVALASFVLVTLMLAALAPSASATTGTLAYGGGPVLHSSAPYLVFWTPRGESVPASSRALIERYLTDVAADSGRSSNVFGVLRQYYDRTGFADYQQTFSPARQVIVDTHPYPSREAVFCPQVSSLYPHCIADDQLQSELQRLLTADHLPTAGSASAALHAGSAPARLSANAPMYNVVLPGDVEVCYQFGRLCTGNQIGGYHGDFVDSGGNVVVYEALPLEPLRAGSVLFPCPKWPDCHLDGTTVVQDPNGDVFADLLINVISHEDSETITDPLNSNAWLDNGLKDEVGDKCEFDTSAKLPPGFGNNPNAFLPTLGGSEAAGTLYTQLINGHPYYTQSEWSNGAGNCEMRPSPGIITPRFAVSRGRHAASRSLTFNPAASTSANAVSSATWSYGDSSPTGFFSGKAALTPATHRYRRAGRYTVTLTLVDNRGNLRSTTRKVTVHARRT